MIVFDLACKCGYFFAGWLFRDYEKFSRQDREGLRNKVFLLLLLLFPILLTSCASLSGVVVGQPPRVYFPPPEDNLLTRFAPLFVPETIEEDYNRIGRPAARLLAGKKESIFVDPAEAIIFAEKRTFTTAADKYTNLIYRIHFTRVPFRLIPFHLTAGKNPGLLVILTMNGDKQPLLVTTVHTCGCYCVITPTTNLPRNAYPQGRQQTTQELWGETLPASVNFEENSGDEKKLLVFLRDGTHRVKNLKTMEWRAVQDSFVPLHIHLEPMATLHSLALNDGSVTSFFENGGWRNGFVKDSYKPWEMLLMSWWAFDLNVGCDKEYGDPFSAGTKFYTSLKPWQHDESDMRNFAGFLLFHGWGL